MSLVRSFVLVTSIMFLAGSALASEPTAVTYPILDWYGIWPGRAAVDDEGQLWTQDRPFGVRLAVQEAVKSAVFIHPQTRWEHAALDPFCVIRENETIRMWYTCRGLGEEARTFVAYAESRDGFSWERPELGLVEFAGSTANNLLFRHDQFPVQSVFVDPDAPPNEYYKAMAPGSLCFHKGVPQPNITRERISEIRASMFAAGYTRPRMGAELYFERHLRGAVSADGIRWKFLPTPILEFGRTGLDSQNIAAYDVRTKNYLAYLRRGLERRRVVVRASGKDFRQLAPASFVFGADPQDPISDDVYASAYCRYPGDSSYHLMFPSFYHRLTSKIDVQLAVSRDGVQWSRPERKPVISLHSQNGNYGMVFAHPNLIRLNERQWGIVMHGNHDLHDWNHRVHNKRGFDWRWATWERDRLVALHAEGEGRVTLVERVCQGKDLRINFKTQKEGGWVKVELIEPPTSPPVPTKVIQGYGLKEADLLRGNDHSRVVTWSGRSDLSALRGQRVSIRLHLVRAQIFSISI